MLKLDGFDGAFIGTAMVWQREDQGATQVETMVYDGSKLIEILCEDGLSIEEAQDYIDYNICGAYVGPQTPIIVYSISIEEIGSE
jgi:hypothetical protein